MKTKKQMNIKSILILLILVPFLSCQKKEVSATLNITIELENKFNKEYADLSFLRIYKDGKIFKEIKAENLPFIQHKIKLEKLKEGKYQFEYTNIFEQKIIKELNIDESRIYNISLNPDYSDYKKNFKKSLIGNLKEKHFLKLAYQSRGCFNSEKDSIVIYKKENFYEVERNGIKTKLNDSQVNNLIKMECQLINIKEGGCTTSDIYTFSFENSKRKFIDATCRWNGWETLQKEMKWK